MVQKVRYNGGTQRMYECSDPTDLIVGKNMKLSKKKRVTGIQNIFLEELRENLIQYGLTKFQKTSIWLFLAENLSQEKYTLALNWSLSVESLN